MDLLVADPAVGLSQHGLPQTKTMKSEETKVRKSAL
jgi:hypothetical protein